MRSRTLPSSTLALLLLAGCHGYVTSSPVLAPNLELVRIPLAHAETVVVERDDPAAGWSDTLENVTAIEGRVVELRENTVRLAVTHLERRGARNRIPPGRSVVIDLSRARSVERYGFSLGRTAAATVGFALLGMAAGLVILLVGLSGAG
jgi:hypothetical protein